ncbi:MAG TPA: zf-HC2 domain-containing protein [Acidimicrobiia bacterium]|nr:zf-HC2 domain-containing protein [Acidimicrobiia bacterium]
MTPLDCREIARVLQAHLDGELAAADAAEVAEHLGECPPCDVEAETYREIKTALRRTANSLPPDMVQRLRRYCDELTAGRG